MKGLYNAVVGLVAAAACASARAIARDDAAGRSRVKLHPVQVRLLADTDHEVWTISDEATASFTTDNGIDLTLSAGNSTLQGDWYRLVYQTFVPKIGERMVGTGISTNDETTGGPLTLTLAGLSEGEHSLLTWHNAWSNIQETATVSISVDGTEVATVRSRANTCTRAG